MFCVILTNDVIELNESLSVDERIKLCEEILAAYPEEFKYEIPKGKPKPITLDYSEKVKSRLCTMGEYIYAASPVAESGMVVSKYRERVDKKREIKLGNMDWQYEDHSLPV